MEEEFVFPRMIYVSHGIGIDHKGRVLVVTYNRQPEIQGALSVRLKDHTILDLEIFDRDGIFLGSLPVPVTFHKMRVSGDRLLLIDESQEVCLYEYKIVEK